MLMADAQPDAIALLKADHRKVEDLFEKFEAAKASAAKLQLVKQICTELTVHSNDRGRNLLSRLQGQDRRRQAERGPCRA
jgi:hypothetical protein